MANYKCFILDDEPLAIRVLEQYISKLKGVEVCGSSTDPLAALEQIKTTQPDLLLLDIQMPEITGLELIGALQHKPEIIITTAYREHAIDGFELNVLDYLVKPIPFNRFVRAIEKFMDAKRQSVLSPNSPGPDHLFVKADRKTIRIPFEEILYVEGIKDYVRIIMSRQNVMTKVSIGHFLKELPPDRFVQIHKSFIVAYDKIKAYTAHDVEIGDVEIPIGRMYKDAFLKSVGIRK